jgi:hypothetical protein
MKIYLSYTEMVVPTATGSEKKYKLFASFREDFTPEYELDSYLNEASFFKLIERVFFRIHNWGKIYVFSINGDAQEDSTKYSCTIEEVTISSDALLLFQKHAWKKTFGFDMPISFIESFNLKAISTAPNLLDGL